MLWILVSELVIILSVELIQYILLALELWDVQRIKIYEPQI
jgi:hypothetical protein